MNKEYEDFINDLAARSIISATIKNLFLKPKIAAIAISLSNDMIDNPPKDYPQLKGSKLSVFLDWLFADPQRVMDFLLKILGIFSENQQERY